MTDAMPEPGRDRGADAATIARLAALDPIEYDRVRQTEAEAMGVRTSTLDSMVKDARPAPEAAHGRNVNLPEVEAWPEPVNGADLLRDLAAAIKQHVILPAAATTATAGWILHTWIHDRFQHTPRLSITSPVKRCGKSTLLDVLRATCHHPLKADNISASGVFRTVEALAPLTLLIDEADSFLGENEELRGVLNSGFEASGEVIRVVEIDGEHQPVRFRTFAPCALAGIGALPGTLEDRALPIVLQRKGAAETVQKLRANGARANLHDLARRCARWAADRGGRLNLDPPVPDALGDREGDIAIPLLSLADDAGGEWPQRVRAALVSLFTRRNADEGAADAGALLLKDIKLLFATGAMQLASADIVQHLVKMEERPWPEWRRGQPMSAPQLARALAPFGIRPGTIRIGQGTAKGYYKDAFAEAWNRYLSLDNPSPPSEGGFKPSHRHTPQNSKATAESEPSHPTPHVTDRKSLNPAENLTCDGVTVSAPPLGDEEVSAGWEARL